MSKYCFRGGLRERRLLLCGLMKFRYQMATLLIANVQFMQFDVNKGKKLSLSSNLSRGGKCEKKHSKTQGGIEEFI